MPILWGKLGSGSTSVAKLSNINFWRKCTRKEARKKYWSSTEAFNYTSPWLVKAGGLWPQKRSWIYRFPANYFKLVSLSTATKCIGFITHCSCSFVNCAGDGMFIPSGEWFIVDLFVALFQVSDLTKFKGKTLFRVFVHADFPLFLSRRFEAREGNRITWSCENNYSLFFFWTESLVLRK